MASYDWRCAMCGNPITEFGKAIELPQRIQFPDGEIMANLVCGHYCARNWAIIKDTETEGHIPALVDAATGLQIGNKVISMPEVPRQKIGAEEMDRYQSLGSEYQFSSADGAAGQPVEDDEPPDWWDVKDPWDMTWEELDEYWSIAPDMERRNRALTYLTTATTYARKPIEETLPNVPAEERERIVFVMNREGKVSAAKPEVAANANLAKWRILGTYSHLRSELSKAGLVEID